MEGEGEYRKSDKQKKAKFSTLGLAMLNVTSIQLQQTPWIVTKSEYHMKKKKKAIDSVKNLNSFNIVQSLLPSSLVLPSFFPICSLLDSF